MTIITPSSWSYFWRFAYCSPVMWLLSYAGAPVLDMVGLLVVVGWLYYVALTVATFCRVVGGGLTPCTRWFSFHWL